MKRIIVCGMLLLSAVLLSGQEEIIFNFSRTKAFIGAASAVKVYVNGAEVAKLINGGSFIYKGLIDKSKPVTVMAKVGFNKREITFDLKDQSSCDIETGFGKRGLMLNLKSGGTIAPGTGAYTETKVNEKDLSISYTAVKTHSSDTIRQQWLEKGGQIMGISYIGGGSYMNMKDDNFSSTGTGGNLTITMTVLNFRIPEYKPQLQTWKSSVFGFTGTDQFFFTKSTVELPPPMEPMTSTAFNMSMMFSFNAGYTLGVGKFKTETRWKGAAFELTYRPSLVISLPTSAGAKADLSVNMTGFGFDINFNSFTSNAAKLAPRAQSKFTFFALPPIKDMPLFISVGYGLTFYQKL